MNGFIGIKTNWYTKVKKHLHVSKQLDYITYKIRLGLQGIDEGIDVKFHRQIDYREHYRKNVKLGQRGYEGVT